MACQVILNVLDDISLVQKGIVEWSRENESSNGNRDRDKQETVLVYKAQSTISLSTVT